MTEQQRKTQRKTHEVPEGKAEASLEPVQLSITDLTGLAQVVDLASRRGAFHAAEMEQVGAYYNKLNAFLVWFKSQQEEATEGEEATAPAPEAQE